MVSWAGEGEVDSSSNLEQESVDLPHYDCLRQSGCLFGFLIRKPSLRG